MNDKNNDLAKELNQRLMHSIPSSAMEIAKPALTQQNLISNMLMQSAAMKNLAGTANLIQVQSPLVNTIGQLGSMLPGIDKWQTISKFFQLQNSYFQSLNDKIYPVGAMRHLVEPSPLMESLMGVSKLAEQLALKRPLLGIDYPLSTQWLTSNAFSSPLTNIFEGIKGLENSVKKLLTQFSNAMYEARWFPYAGFNNTLRTLQIVFKAFNEIEDSQVRTKEIDEFIFSCYEEEELCEMKEGWQNGNPALVCRFAEEAIQSYQDEKYYSVITSLATLWERIIREKISPENVGSSKMRHALKKLIDDDCHKQILIDYYDKYVGYDCKSIDKIKPDAPGRHMVAHGWYKEYPSKKAALNAILFTDFLLNLKPLEKADAEKEDVLQDDELATEMPCEAESKD